MADFTTKNFFKFDDYMTPKEAWYNIKDIIPKNKVIWEAFYGDGTSGSYLKELGFEVIHENIDFFENDLGEIIVSNPPFSKKQECLARLKELDKPFILIMPVSALTTRYMKKLFENQIQILIPPKKIQFIKYENGKAINNGKCYFDCLYYCYKIGLDRDITYL